MFAQSHNSVFFIQYRSFFHGHSAVLQYSTGMKKKVLVLGLNPAWQKILIFEDLVRGKVNRARDLFAFASGKGANFARITERCGNDAVLAQFIGGVTGSRYEENLSRNSSIVQLTQHVDAETRVCTTLLTATPDATELIEPSRKVSAENAAALLEKALAVVPECDGVAICGTFPPGVTVDFYLEIAKLAKKEGKPLIVDSYKGISPVLHAGVDILKINRRELSALSEEEDVFSGGNRIRKDFPVNMLAVTDGPDKAYLFSDDGFTECPVPFIDKVVNPIGAGDTVSAVLFSEYLDGTPIRAAFDKALKEGSESCRSLVLGRNVALAPHG